MFSRIKNADAIGITPLPKHQVVTLSKRKVNRHIRPSNIAINSQKEEKIKLRKLVEIDSYLILLSPEFAHQIDKEELIKKALKKIRGGDRFELAVGLALLILILQLKGVGIQGFQVPIVHPNEGFLGQGGPVHHLHQHQKSGGRIRVNMSNSKQVSTNIIPTQTQMSGFVKNGKIDLHQCLSEVQRRASEIGCQNFECSFERFKALATENGKITNITAREAITVLQGEMHGYYTNARRENYGSDIKGIDFVVEGLGNFQNITHVEVKNPVGSAIKIALGQKSSITKQGKKIGQKIIYQQNYWSNSTKTSELENLNPTTK